MFKMALRFCFGSFILRLLTVNISEGHNAVFHSHRRMSWYDNNRYCRLGNEQRIKSYDAQFRAWAGGIYLDTPWMVHKGCYSYNLTVHGKVHAVTSNSPAMCSFQCNKAPYFALQKPLITPGRPDKKPGRPE